MATLASPASGLLRGARRRESLPCGRLEYLESASALTPKTPLDCRSPLAGDPSFGPRSIRMATIASPASGLLRGARRRESLPCGRLEYLESARALKPKTPLDCRSPLAGDPSFGLPDPSEWPPSLRPQAGSYGVRGGANRYRAEGWNVSNRLTPSSPKHHSTVGARLRAIRRSAPDLSEWPPSLRPQAGSCGVRGGANRFRAKGWNVSNWLAPSSSKHHSTCGRSVVRPPIYQNGRHRFARKRAPTGCAAARIASVRKAGISRIGSPSTPKHHPIVGARLRAIRRSASPIHQNGHHRFARKRAPAGCTAARITTVRKVGISRIGSRPKVQKTTRL